MHRTVCVRVGVGGMCTAQCVLEWERVGVGGMCTAQCVLEWERVGVVVLSSM